MSKKEMTFTFHSNGAHHAFSPFKEIICPFEKRKRNQLDFHRDLVKFRDDPAVFILDNTGHILKV